MNGHDDITIAPTIREQTVLEANQDARLGMVAARRSVQAEQAKSILFATRSRGMAPPTSAHPQPCQGMSRRSHITVSQAAKIAGVSARQVRRYLESGQLSGRRCGKRGWWQVELASLEIISDESDKPDIAARDYVR